jgi:hypothetical protein
MDVSSAPSELFQRIEAGFLRQGLMPQTIVPLPKTY